MDRKFILGKYKKIETTGVDSATGEPIPQNKLDAIYYYNEALKNLVFSNDDIARIKLKKARALDPELTPAGELFEELREEPVMHEPAKAGISVVRFKVDFAKIFVVLASLALIVFLVWAVVNNMYNSAANNKIIGQSSGAMRTDPDDEATERPADTAAPSASSGSTASAAATQTPMVSGSYAEFSAKLNQAKTYSDAGDHINAMKTVNSIKGFSFNPTDAAKLTAIINASRRSASYASYYQGLPLMDQGKYAEAIPYINDSLAFGGLEENVEWVEYLDAYLYYMAGKYSEAKTMFTAFAAKYPNSYYKDQVNNYLNELRSK